MSSFAVITRNWKLVKEIVKKNRRKIIFLLSFFAVSSLVGIVGAIIYNWLYITGNARIGPAFSSNFRYIILLI